MERYIDENRDEQKTKFPKLIPMVDIEEKEPEWLVPNYLPKKCISIMAGDGGVGKGYACCGIVAGISTGKQVFFDDTTEESATCKPQKTLIFSSEDSLEYTLRARLRKAGANLNNVFAVSLQDETFKDIKFNSPILEKLIEEAKPALVVFDPLQSFVPSNMPISQRNAVRDCLNPLIRLGEKYDCTFLIIMHTNKKQFVFGRNRVSDSADIWDIARSVMIVGQTQDGERYLSHEKSNYGKLGRTAIFDIENDVAVFKEFSNKKDRDFVQERDVCARLAPQREDAEKFILEFLRNGKMPTAALDKAAMEAEISKATLRRAKEQLRNKKLLGLKSEGNGTNKVFYSFLIEPFT